MEKWLVISVFVSAVVLSVGAIQWRDCGSKGAKIDSLAVTGCATAQVCPLSRGKNASVTVTFTPNAAITQATAVVHGIVAGVPVPYKIPQEDGCQNCGITCPLKSGQQYTYSTDIFVSKEYPKLKLVVEWELQDQNKADIFCFEVPAEVTD